jgi:hypothetical protein
LDFSSAATIDTMAGKFSNPINISAQTITSTQKYREAVKN